MDLESLESVNRRILYTVLKSEVGIPKVLLKRRITELSKESETISKLQIEKSHTLNQIQIESNHQRYLQSINEDIPYKQQLKRIDQQLLNEKNEEAENNYEDNSDDEEDEAPNGREIELKKSIFKLKEELLNLASVRSEQKMLFTRLFQSSLLPKFNQNELLDLKLFQLLKVRDEKVEKCLKLVNKIDDNNKEISNIRKQRLSIMSENRELFNQVNSDLNDSKKDPERETYKVYKENTDLMSFIIQNLIYYSGIDWYEDELLSRFFDQIDIYDDDYDEEKESK